VAPQALRAAVTATAADVVRKVRRETLFSIFFSYS
jgi:hypothetical protein